MIVHEIEDMTGVHILRINCSKEECVEVIQWLKETHDDATVTSKWAIEMGEGTLERLEEKLKEMKEVQFGEAAKIFLELKTTDPAKYMFMKLRWT